MSEEETPSWESPSSLGLLQLNYVRTQGHSFLTIHFITQWLLCTINYNIALQMCTVKMFSNPGGRFTSNITAGGGYKSSGSVSMTPPCYHPLLSTFMPMVKGEQPSSSCVDCLLAPEAVSHSHPWVIADFSLIADQVASPESTLSALVSHFANWRCKTNISESNWQGSVLWGPEARL